MPAPPSLAELTGLGEQALAHAEGEAQATVTWQHDGDGERISVELTCVIDGRAARAVAATPDAEGLRRAAKAAALHARRMRAWPTPGLPDPVAPPPRRDGARPPVPAIPATEPPDLPGVAVSVQTTTARVAIVSTRGVRVAEKRTAAVATVTARAGERVIELREAAPLASLLHLADLAAEARALLRPGERPVDAPAGELPVVLGHDAVAIVLDHLRPAFGVELALGGGPLHGRLGARVAAAGIHLADAAGQPGTLAGRFDAEGIPRRQITLIEDGIARGRVHDTASAARAGTSSTGHASRAAALAPVPDHLVMSGGDAVDVAELCAPVARGLYVPSLSRAREADGEGFVHTTHGAILIERGCLTQPVHDAQIRLEPLALLTAVTALTAQTRTIPAGGELRGSVVPALRIRTSVYAPTSIRRN